MANGGVRQRHSRRCTSDGRGHRRGAVGPYAREPRALSTRRRPWRCGLGKRRWNRCLGFEGGRGNGFDNTMGGGSDARVRTACMSRGTGRWWCGRRVGDGGGLRRGRGGGVRREARSSDWLWGPERRGKIGMPWWKGEADARAGEATGAEFLRTKFVLFFILRNYCNPFV
jgi:hypothetical protein